MTSRRAHGDLTAIIRDFADGVTRLPRRGGNIEVFANLAYMRKGIDKYAALREMTYSSPGNDLFITDYSEIEDVVQTLRITAASADDDRFLLEIVKTLEVENLDCGEIIKLVNKVPCQQYLVARKDLGAVLRMLQPEPCAMIRMSYGCRLRLAHGAVDLKHNLKAVKEACATMTYLLLGESFMSPHAKTLASVADDAYANFAAIRNTAGKYADMIKVLPA
ncbi:hypothetical protein M885DRAFT_524816 [Pelagophyceae sp. CCMP2097]|nr:hypothetical protein M885DRAFT_524816 [Pelagophyceae sp. CCMP2097]|mmetsp:Transcript_22375/g.75700  ORF Transcript_22375/g.75700 Transcript_22375/m.75700 type:complete len:220 (-) Transcript_22375:216-875(-)